VVSAETQGRARKKIVTEEARAQLFLETDIDRKAKEVADLQEVLKDRISKLAEGSEDQVDYCVSSACCDERRRELDLTVERKSAGIADSSSRQSKQEPKAAETQRLLEKERADAPPCTPD